MAPANDAALANDSAGRPAQAHQPQQQVCKQPIQQPPETNNNNHDLMRATSGDELSAPSDAPADKASVVVIETCALGQPDAAAGLQVNGAAERIRSELAGSTTKADHRPDEQDQGDKQGQQQQSKVPSQTLSFIQQPQRASQQPTSVYPAPKRRRLSYLQTLLLRRWPYLALAICIMSSLLFGVLLSGLTVYLMHAHVSECMSSLLPAGEPSAAHVHARLRQQVFPDPSSLELAGPLESRSAGPSASNSSTKRASFQRLPRSVWPTHYDLFIQPHLVEPFNFDGKVSVAASPRDRPSRAEG